MAYDSTFHAWSSVAESISVAHHNRSDMSDKRLNRTYAV